MRQEFVTLGGKMYCYVDQAPSHGQPKATLLCLHGFPDQWYGWENQIAAWSKAGYRVIVPHMLGYGQSDKPSDPSAYSTKNLSRDLALLLDDLQLNRVIVVGHDWGAAVAWRFALWYPGRVIALAAISVPYFPPSKVYIPPSEATKRVPTFAYQEFFADPASTKEIDANVDRFIPALFQLPRPTEGNSHTGTNIPILRPGQMQAFLRSDKSVSKLPLALSTHELTRYVQDFTQGGMNGPLSYYRNFQARFEDEKEAGLPTIFPSNIPVLFIYGTQDSTCPQGYVSRMPDVVPNLKIVRLEDKGHWLLLEAGEEVNANVLAFLEMMQREQLVGQSIASVRL